MRLLILRHAAARPGSPDVADEDRPLSSRGRKRFKKAAKGLAEIVGTPDLLLTSPLLRARQTAKIAGKVWKLGLTEEPLLAGGSPEALVQAMTEHPKDSVVALVGHEPDLSRLLAHVVGGAGERFPFKKGGAALVELDGTDGAGRLIWFMPPRCLRAFRA
ncbi:MAG TPA: histidine phosphatase family protein [Candidatus Methylomirabilis sp.]|nr:histidine phosphatase family protein [Candidatus Methylomirabilis sp.]